MIRLLALLGLALGACSAEPPRLKLTPVPVDTRPQPGPPVSPEELSGEVPPLMGLALPAPLVPPEMIPPAPPPEPPFDPKAD